MVRCSRWTAPKGLLRAGVLVALLGAGSCADVSVLRDDGSACMDGFRYYLPRPWIALKKPMPVAGDEIVVNGRLHLKHQVVEVNVAQLPKEIKKQFMVKGDRAYIPLSTIKLVDVGALAAKSTAEKEEGEGTKEKEKEKEKETPTPAPAPTTKSAATAESGGPLSAADGFGSVVSPTGADFDVVYLPDYDERYVIKFKAGLGQAGTGPNGMILRHGWMLENFSVNISNERLGEFVYGLANQFSGVVERMAQVNLLPSKMWNLPPNAPPWPDSKPPEPGADASGEKGPPDSLPVSLRIVYVLMAQPGMYPILKPNEARTKGGCVTCPGLCEKEGELQHGEDWLLVPFPPFTSIPYSIKRQVSVLAFDLAAGSDVTKDPNDPTATAPGRSEKVIRADLEAWLKRVFGDEDIGPAADAAEATKDLTQDSTGTWTWTLTKTVGDTIKDEGKAALEAKVEGARAAGTKSPPPEVKKLVVNSAGT